MASPIVSNLLPDGKQGGEHEQNAERDTHKTKVPRLPRATPQTEGETHAGEETTKKGETVHPPIVAQTIDQRQSAQIKQMGGGKTQTGTEKSMIHIPQRNPGTKHEIIENLHHHVGEGVTAGEGEISHGGVDGFDVHRAGSAERHGDDEEELAAVEQWNNPRQTSAKDQKEGGGEGDERHDLTVDGGVRLARRRCHGGETREEVGVEGGEKHADITDSEGDAGGIKGYHAPTALGAQQHAANEQLCPTGDDAGNDVAETKAQHGEAAAKMAQAETA